MGNKKVNEILSLVKKGISLSLATIIVTGGLTACDLFQGSEQTTTTTEPGITNLTLSQEDAEFLNNFYVSLASYDSRYAGGIGNIKIDVTTKSDEKEYQIKIGFPNDESFKTNNLQFTLNEGDGMIFMGRCKDAYASRQKLDGSEITILSDLSETPNDRDVHFYRHLNKFTSELVKSNTLDR